MRADLWTTGAATLQGKHYQVDGAICRRGRCRARLPGSPNGIPMWIAGGGEKKTLRIAAEYADYTNFDGTPEGFAHKSEVLRGHCADVGRDFDEIVRSANYNVVIGATRRRSRTACAWIRDHYRRSACRRSGVEGQLRRVPRAARGRHARADRREAAAPAGARA